MNKNISQKSDSHRPEINSKSTKIIKSTNQSWRLPERILGSLCCDLGASWEALWPTLAPRAPQRPTKTSKRDFATPPGLPPKIGSPDLPEVGPQPFPKPRFSARLLGRAWVRLGAFLGYNSGPKPSRIIPS